MLIETRYANNDDFEWLVQKDNHVSGEWVKRCISHNEYIVAIENGQKLGFLRFSLFWGDIPYMDMIRVKESHQRKGVGTSLFNFWEQEMRAKDAKILMTSSVLHETDPQTWHKRNGFKKSGQLTFGRHEPVPEVFFVKDL